MTKYIEKFMLKDLKALYGLSRVGYFSHQQLKENIKLTEHRIKNMVKDKLVEKRQWKGSKTPNSTEHIVYRLTDKGYSFLKQSVRGEYVNSLNLGETGRYHSSSPSHDVALADKYLNLNWKEQQSWRTENESREIFNQHLESIREQGKFELYNKLQEQYKDRDISMPDGVYISDSGESIAIEIEGDKYSQKMIQSKINLCKELGYSYEGHRI